MVLRGLLNCIFDLSPRYKDTGVSSLRRYTTAEKRGICDL
jgi:hypothetical protein